MIPSYRPCLLKGPRPNTARMTTESHHELGKIHIQTLSRGNGMTLLEAQVGLSGPTSYLKKEPQPQLSFQTSLCPSFSNRARRPNGSEITLVRNLRLDSLPGTVHSKAMEGS